MTIFEFSETLVGIDRVSRTTCLLQLGQAYFFLVTEDSFCIFIQVYFFIMYNVMKYMITLYFQ